MNLIRLFYADEATASGGAATDTNAASSENNQSGSSAAAANTPVVDIPVGAFTLEDLKNFGFDSKEKAAEFLSKAKELQKTEADKEKEAIIEESNMMRYAAERDLINDDVKNYKSLQAKTERDLVFEKFSKEEKTDNPDITDEELKDAFESEYKLNSDNEKAKAKGEAKLKKEADQIRKPSVEAWNNVHNSFKEAQEGYRKKQEFESIVKDVVSKAIPEKLTIKLKDKETEVPLEVDVAKEIKEKAQKMFDNEKGLVKYLVHEGTKEQFATTIGNKINAFIEAETNKAALQKVFEAGIGIGTKKGSTVGAENLFALNQGSGGKTGGKVLSIEESNNKIAEARERAKNNRR